jgi:hypothetical protein
MRHEKKINVFRIDDRQLWVFKRVELVPLKPYLPVFTGRENTLFFQFFPSLSLSLSLSLLKEHVKAKEPRELLEGSRLLTLTRLMPQISAQNV